MTAKEARELATSFIEPIDGGQYKEIKACIKKAAEKGEFQTFYYEQVRKPIHTRLQQEGYKLEEYWERSDYMLKIQW